MPKSSHKLFIRKKSSSILPIIGIIILGITILTSVLIIYYVLPTAQTASINKIVEQDPSIARTAVEKKAVDKLNNAANADARAKTKEQKEKAAINLYVAGAVVEKIANMDKPPESPSALETIEKGVKEELANGKYLDKDANGNLVLTAVGDYTKTAVYSKPGGTPAIPTTPVSPGSPVSPTSPNPLKNCVQGSFGCPYDFAYTGDESCGRSVAGFYCWGGEQYVIGIPSTQMAASEYFGKVASTLNGISDAQLSTIVNARPGNTIEEKLDNYLKSLSVLDKNARANLLAEYISRIDPSLTGVSGLETDLELAELAEENRLELAALAQKAAEEELKRISAIYENTTCGGKLKEGEKCINVSLDPNDKYYQIVPIDYVEDLNQVQLTPDNSQIAAFIFGTPQNSGGGTVTGQNGNLNQDNFVYYSQKDPAFTSSEDGITKMSLAKVGCGTSVTAMLFTNYTDQKLDPLETRDTYFTHENYTNSGFYYSDAMVPLSAAGFEFKDISGRVGISPMEEISTATYENPIVLGFDYSGAPKGHYVLAVGQDSSGTPLVYDPYHYDESGSQDPIPLNTESFPGMDLEDADVIVVTPPGE